MHDVAFHRTVDEYTVGCTWLALVRTWLVVHGCCSEYSSWVAAPVTTVGVVDVALSTSDDDEYTVADEFVVVEVAADDRRAEVNDDDCRDDDDVTMT